MTRLAAPINNGCPGISLVGGVTHVRSRIAGLEHVHFGQDYSASLRRISRSSRMMFPASSLSALRRRFITSRAMSRASASAGFGFSGSFFGGVTIAPIIAEVRRQRTQLRENEGAI
jgi:hypothetical protein